MSSSDGPVDVRPILHPTGRPMRSAALLLAAAACIATGGGAAGVVASGPTPNVPLVRWSPNAEDFTFCYAKGVSFGDYNADSFPDLFIYHGGQSDEPRLWLNQDNGNGERTWVCCSGTDGVPFCADNCGIQCSVVYNGFPFAPGTCGRYGSSFADYNNDGRPDLALEPRAPLVGSCGVLDSLFYLLRNDTASGGGFTALSGAPHIRLDPFTPTPVLIQGCSETIGWVDADFDGFLDMILPCYGTTCEFHSPNFFLHNLGPDKSGAYSFQEMHTTAGLQKTRFQTPEGGQFCDIDGDGDADWWSNDEIYQNRSRAGIPVGTPRFVALDAAASGLFDPAAPGTGSGDEGGLFFDYDADGDQDLVVAHTTGSKEVRVYESRGDGTFFTATGVISNPDNAGGTGMSAEDWDNDGDIDFTFTTSFQLNQLKQTGVARFRDVAHSVTTHLGVVSTLTPAWADWDHDGDLDCAVGTFASDGATFYENTLYDGVKEPSRRFVKVRPLRDPEPSQLGVDLETEYGASVEVLVDGETNFRRKKFTASGHGYVNQNEYTLTFGLEGLTAPTQFDIAVDFINDPRQGNWRVDRHVNPLLRDVDLDELGSDRRFDVFRSGRVRIGNSDLQCDPQETPLLRNAGGGLALPHEVTGLPAPTPPISRSGTFVGIELVTQPDAGFVRVAEVVVDGELAPAAGALCGQFNLALWELDGNSTKLIDARDVAASSRNHRTFITTDWILAPNLTYRIVARINRYRANPLTHQGVLDGVRTSGGLLFDDPDPCDAEEIAGAAVHSNTLYMTARYRKAQVCVPRTVTAMGGVGGGDGDGPTLTSTGDFPDGVRLVLENAAPHAMVELVVGDGVRTVAHAGRPVVVPVPERLSPLVWGTDSTGALSIPLAPIVGERGSLVAYQLRVVEPTVTRYSNTIFFEMP